MAMMGSATSYPSAVATVPETLGGQMQALRKDVQELAGRLSGIADRVSGSRPQGVEPDVPSSPCLHGVTADIRRGLNALRDEINRLDSSI